MASAIQHGTTTIKTFSKPPPPTRSTDLRAPPAGLGALCIGGIALSRVSLSAVQVQSGVSLMVVVEQKWRLARSGFFLFLRM